ncbi:MAG: hypothetical protein NC818_00620 [Candidatus Omnitrophica bacterium]|nr:hypothetical protein [Candidatus Omnitrophota bacterium]
MSFIYSERAIPAEINDYLDKLIFVDLQTSAVTIEMYKYLGWVEDRNEWGRASLKAIGDLEKIKEHLESLDFPEELNGLKNMYGIIIASLKSIYTGIDQKDESKIKSEFRTFNTLYAKYSENLKMFKDVKKQAGTSMPVEEILKFIDNEEDKNNFLQAVKLMKSRKYLQAYSILNKLKEKYSGTVFGDCVMLKITDCYLREDTDIEVVNRYKATEDALIVLKTIINKNVYSPILYEAFYKWRTIEQEFNHGMSNISDIPNMEYNEQRWKIVQVIKAYLKDNPLDRWAKIQIDLLLGLPNIKRGGAMGNDNLIHWGVLYTDLAQRISPNF